MRKISKESYSDRVRLPYDPEDVNIRLQHFRIGDLISMIDKDALDILDEEYSLIDAEYKLKSGQVDLFGRTSDEVEEEELDDIELDIDSSDDIQRTADLWNNVQKSRFIESLMIKLPIPMFYFDGSKKPWRVVDGLQRLHTIRGFIKGEFRLTGLEYLVKECDGKFFTDSKLPGYLKARISEAEIIAYVINPGTPPDVKYNIFKRINTGGLKLNGQEIRNAFFRGKPANFTKELASYEEFKEATNKKVTGRRMMDREYANRFIAFQVFDFEEYNGKMDLFLSEAMMNLYEREKDEFDELRESFQRALLRASVLIGEHAFYRPDPNEGWGRQPNKALFDTMSWNLAELSDREFSRLENRSDRFINLYRSFMTRNEAMHKSINDTTGSKTAVRNRFTLLNQFLKEYIQ